MLEKLIVIEKRLDAVEERIVEIWQKEKKIIQHVIHQLM